MAENEETEEGTEVPQTKILQDLMQKFSKAEDAKEIQEAFNKILEEMESGENGEKPYQILSQKTEFHKVIELRKTFEAKLNSNDYKKEGKEACKGRQALVVGAGPCGLRAAIELAFLGFRVTVVEKRDTFSRNSILQLWTFLVEDLKSIGFRVLFPKFGVSERNHISIRRLQIVLMKLALLLGVEIQIGVEFEDVKEPKKKDKGWTACVKPANHPVSKFEFEFLIIASGQQSKQLTDVGFSWVNIERALAIAIAANFKNKKKTEDLDQEDIGGLSVMNTLEIFNELKDKKDADIENIFYLRDETHYFVMTGKRENLLKRGVLKKDTGKKSLLNKDNIDREELKKFVKDVANHCTKEKIDLEFTQWANGEDDVAIFEFTSRSHAKEAALVKEPKGKKKLLMGLVGDSLKQPFWPEGVGIAHGFFSVYDTAWMAYEWYSKELTEEKVLANRKHTYTCLKAMTKDSLSAIREYRIDPFKRYAQYRAIKNQEDADEKKDKEEKEKDKKTKKEKNNKKVAEDGEAEKKKEKSKGKFRWRFWKKKEKKASSAENIAVHQTDNDKKKDAGEFKRERFHSLRKSFRRMRPGSRKEKKDKNKKIQEDTGDKEAENDVAHQQRFSAVVSTSEGENADSKNQEIDVTVQVHESSDEM